jgi:predicted nuclease of predicted toxin-antitoxin system
VSDDRPFAIKLLVDEDLSPWVAQSLREGGVDAIHLRDRGRLGATDQEVLELPFQEDRVLVTANVGDFEMLASRRELHGGIVLVLDGALRRDEQLVVVRRAAELIGTEQAGGRDMVNRVLRISLDGVEVFEERAAP